MIAVLSPAKTLDYESPVLVDAHSQPEYLDEAEELIRGLRKCREEEIGALMSISPKLASLNVERYRDWKRPFTFDNARQALLAFKGDVYTGFSLDDYTKKDFTFAQDHLRILSGLYGLLRPLDLMQPYRLEMGTAFSNARGNSLYAYWGDQLAKKLSKELAKDDGVLLNLASKEYFQAVPTGAFEGRVISPVFKDWKKGKLKIISFFAKKARGTMADFLIRERIKKPDDLKGFTGMGYAFDAEGSSGDEWLFTREEGEAA